LAAARRVFAQAGYDGAKTLQIARAAGVSEALVYRHFPSKQALYRAVLRQIFREQDDNWKTLGIPDPSTEALVRTIKNYLYAVVVEPHGAMHEGYMMILASLSADGTFASLLYRRSLRRTNRHIEEAHAAARASGDIAGKPLNISDTAMFIEHVGTMLNATRTLKQGSQPYTLAGEELAREAVWFCCRGIGLTEEAVARFIDA
jgi:AcrR family transcriptional regulator